MKGHTRTRGTGPTPSIEVLVHRGKGRYVTRTVRWQGNKKATQDEADRVLRRLLDEYDTDIGADATVSQLVTRWRRHSEPDWSPTTVAAYDSYLRNHIEPALGSKKVAKVTAFDLDDLYADLRTKGLSPASIGKVHVILRRAFSEAVRWKWLASNPAHDARPPKVARPELQPPAAGQVWTLLEQTRETAPDFFAFLTLAADSGARRGELCALRWSDIDLEAGEATISRAVVVKGGEGVVEKDTKTHQARRIALGAPCVTALREHRRKAQEKALAAGVRLGPGAYVFSPDLAHRRPWRPDNVTARFARLRARCGCEDECEKPEHDWRKTVRLHDLRHALITDWLAAGVDSRTVMGRVGHASLQTLTRYAHFVPAQDSEAAARLGARHTKSG